jgi:hypothetical protein
MSLPIYYKIGAIPKFNSHPAGEYEQLLGPHK